MNNWRLLLFAVFCIFQPISSENLFNGRERCLQHPDFYRKDSRFPDHSNARSEIRRGDRNGREFSERVNDYGLRFSERNLNRDESLRSDRRPRSDDSIRVSLVSRERFASNEDRVSRASRKDRREPKLRSVREARLYAEREVTNLRFIRSLSGDRRDDREETRESGKSRYTPKNRRFIERYFDDSQNRVTRSRQVNEQTESRNLHDQEQVGDFLRRDDSSRRNSERLLREYQGNYDNRRHVVRSETIRDVNDVSRRSASAASRRFNEQRDSVQRSEPDESRAFRREFRHSYDEASERTVVVDYSRRQTNELITRAQSNVPIARRNDVRSKLSHGEIDPRSSPTAANGAFERRITDEFRQNRRELRASSGRVYDRESVRRRGSERSRDFRRELRDNNDKLTGRNVRWVDSPRRTNERLVRGNEIREHHQFRRETRDSDRTDLRFDSQSMRNVRPDARHNSRMDLSRNNIGAITRRASSWSIRDVNERVEYMQGRDSIHPFRRETGVQRNDESSIARASSNERRTSTQNIAVRKESVERSDDTRHFRRESRSESDIRFVRFGNSAERINERESNRRERQNTIKEFVPIFETKRSFVTIARNVYDRAPMRRGNLNERNLRREIKSIRLNDSSRRDIEWFARVQREQNRITRDVDIRALHVEFRQDDRRVDENRRTARITRDSRATNVRDDEASRYIRNNERTKERSMERTVFMPIRRIQRDDTSKSTRINDLHGLRNTFDQKSSQNRISKERISDDENRQRRFIQESRYESRSIKKTFEQNMERDNSKRLDSNDNRRERDSRRSALRDNQSSGNVRDNKNREEIRVSIAHDEGDTFSFKWQHLLYLVHAAYIVGILAKLPQSKENFEKKTRIGIWNPLKLIKVD